MLFRVMENVHQYMEKEEKRTSREVEPVKKVVGLPGWK